MFSVVVAGQWINRVNHPPTGAKLAEDIRQANGLTPQTPEEIQSEIDAATKESGETVDQSSADTGSDEHSAAAVTGRARASPPRRWRPKPRATPEVSTPPRASTPRASTRRCRPSCAPSPGSTIGGMHFEAGTLLDGLAAMMLFTVCLISLLVHIYSTEYLKGDVRFTHYYAFLSLFTASMLFYVLSSNTLQMLVGWELVGVCSFALIGHWWEEKKNSDAALKAFLTNRVGDMGLIIGVIITFFAAGRHQLQRPAHQRVRPVGRRPTRRSCSSGRSASSAG